MTKEEAKARWAAAIQEVYAANDALRDAQMACEVARMAYLTAASQDLAEEDRAAGLIRDGR